MSSEIGWSLVVALSLGPAMLSACSGGGGKDDPAASGDDDDTAGDDDDDTTDDDDDDTTGDDDDTTGDDDDDTTGDDDDATGATGDPGDTGDSDSGDTDTNSTIYRDSRGHTGLAYVTFSGDAVVTPGSSYVGSETIGYTLGIGAYARNLCQWTWEANDTSGPGSDVPCTDPDGNACTFQFEVAFTNGAEGPELGGALCAAVNFQTDNGSDGYGFIESYQSMGTEVATDLWLYAYDFSRAYPSLPKGSYYWISIGYADFDGTNFAYELTNGPFLLTY